MNSDVFGENLGSLRTDYSFGIVRFRSHSKSEPNEDEHTEKSVYPTFGREERYLRSTAASSSRFASKSSRTHVRLLKNPKQSFV